MLYDNIAIVGLAHVDAPIELASAAIEDQLSETMTRLNIHQGLLEGLSGIKSRRLWEEGFKPSDAATLAAEKALEESGVDRTTSESSSTALYAEIISNPRRPVSSMGTSSCHQPASTSIWATPVSPSSTPWMSSAA